MNAIRYSNRGIHESPGFDSLNNGGLIRFVNVGVIYMYIGRYNGEYIRYMTSAGECFPVPFPTLSLSRLICFLIRRNFIYLTVTRIRN